MIQMKRWISCLLVLCMVLSMVPVTAHAETYSGTCGENLAWVLDEDGVLTISGSGPMTDYSSTSSIPWYSYRKQITKAVISNGVTAIGSRAFYQCSKMVSLTIPDSVTAIGNSACSSCSSLTDVTIPAGVTVIGDSAFSSCSSLTDVMIPGSVAALDESLFYNCSNLTEVIIGEGVAGIGNSAFQGCANLTSIDIPNSVTRIGKNAFYGCSSLTNVDIPNSVTSIGSSVFYDCSSLTNVTISNSVTSIGSSMFHGCSSLTNVTIPNSVTSMGNSVFYDCSSLTEVTIPNSVTSIGDSVFHGCSSLTKVMIPGSVTSIGDYVFHGCSNLNSAGPIGSGCSIEYGWTDSIPEKAFYNHDGMSSVVIADGVTSIGNYAFYGCSSLAKVDIPNSGISIGNYAFYGCSSLANVDIPNGVTSIGNSAFSDCTNLSKVIIPNSVAAIGSMAFDDCGLLTSAGPIGSGCAIEFGWSDSIPYRAFSSCEYLSVLILPNGITGIGDAAFSGCKKLSGVTIPDSVISIGSNAFYGCKSLVNIEIPDSVQSIGESVFNGCSGLVSVSIGDGVTGIGERAFSGCSSLVDVSIGGSVTSIGDRAFNGCSSLVEVSIGDSVTSIGSSAFSGCTKLASVVIPNSVISMGGSAFADCSGLTNAVIGNGLTAIDTGTFEKCKNLSGVTIGSGVSRIEQRAFQQCSSLRNVTIPDNVTFLGSDAFRNCSGLTSVKIGDGVDAIRSGAFQNCSSLTSVEIGEGVTSIGKNAFNGSSSLVSVEIPDNVTKIEQYAFYNCDALTHVKIGKNLSTISSYVFEGCEGLTSVGPIGSGCTIEYGWVESIPANAFSHCSSLEHVMIADGIASIGNYAFSNCVSLANIVMPGSVASIGSDSFNGCTTLTSLILPDGVASIDNDAFYNCTNLSKVVIPDTVTTMGASVFGGCDLLTSAGPIGSGCSIELGWTESIPAKALTECESLTSVIIPDGIRVIGDQAFYGNAALSSVSIPDSVTVLGSSVFSGCKGLDNVTLPDGLALIGSKTFYDCTGLTGLTLPDSVISIGTEAFYGCTALTSITIPERVSVIDSGTFYRCSSLSEVTIPDSITSIGYQAFSDCKSLCEVTIGSGVTEMGNYCFEDCDALTTVIIPDNVVSMGYSAFSNCDSLTKAVIGNSVDSIDGTFSSCPKLTDVTIGDSVERIESSAFSNCIGLTSVVLPDSVELIYDYVFSGCTGLTKVFMEGDAPRSIGDNIFQKVTATVFYPKNNKTWTADVMKNYGGTITWVEYDPYAFEENESIRFFRKWDADDQIAYFGINATDAETPGIAVRITEETDVSFLEELDALVGTYVLAQIQSAEAGTDSGDVLLGIRPLETRSGIITSIGEYMIHIDNVAYPLSDTLYPLAFSAGDMVIFHLYNDGVVGIQAYDGSIPAPELPVVPEPEYRLVLAPGGETRYVEIGKTLEIICKLYYGDEQITHWIQPRETISLNGGTEAVTSAGWEKRKDGSYALTLNGTALGTADVVISESTCGATAEICVEVVPPTGNGTKEYPYRITSESDFAAIAQAPDAYYVVDADFEITQPNNIEFTGHFNGNYHTITLSGEMTIGLFLINRGTIDKVDVYRDVEEMRRVATFLDYDFAWREGALDAGNICTYNSGTISDCTVRGDQSFTTSRENIQYNIGSITGYNRGIISRCLSDLNISTSGVRVDSMYFGGIVGYNDGQIIDCINTGNVKPDIDAFNPVATNATFWVRFYAGGIAGRSDGLIDGCIQAGSLVYAKALCCLHTDGLVSVPHDLQCGFILGGEYHFGSQSYTVNAKYVRDCYVSETSEVRSLFYSNSPAKWTGGEHSAEESAYTVLSQDEIERLWNRICLDTDYEASSSCVLKFVKWDAENQIAYFGSSPDKDPTNQGYQVMENSETDVPDDVGVLVGTYVLAETRVGKDGQIAPGILLGIKPVETKTGTITAFGGEEIYIDGQAYRVTERLYPLFFKVGDLVRYHLYNGEIVGIGLYQEEPEYELIITPADDTISIQVGKTLKLKCRLYHNGVLLTQWDQPEASFTQGEDTDPLSLVGWTALPDGSYELTLKGEAPGNAYVVISENTGGTSVMRCVEVTQSEGNLFRKATYHADRLLEDEVVNLDYLIEQINQYSPAAQILNSSDVDDWDKAWHEIRLLYDTLAEGDAYVKRQFEQTEIYEAVLLSALECATNDQSAYAWGLSTADKTTEVTNEILSWLQEAIELHHDWKLDADAEIFSMTKKQKENVIEELEKSLEKGGFSDAVTSLKNSGDFLKHIMQVATTAKDLVEKTMVYLELWYVSDSMANVLDEMMNKIPDTKEYEEMRDATEFCADMIRETSREQFQTDALLKANFMTAGKEVITEGTAYIWGKIQEKVTAKNPKLKFLLLAYKVGRTVTKYALKTDSVTEELYKLRAVNQYVCYLESAILPIKKQYQDAATEENANTLLNAVSLLHALAAEECDITYALSDVIDEAKAEKILKEMRDFINHNGGNLDGEDARAILMKYASDTKEYFVCNNVDAATHWVFHMEEDFPEYYPIYAELIGDDRYQNALIVPLTTDYVIECPVDVRVYTGNGELAADLHGDGMYILGDVSAIQAGDRKFVSIRDGNEYYIVCDGYADGIMRITVREYQTTQQIRDVIFYDLKVSADSVHELETRTDHEDTAIYTVTCADESIPADLDTGIEKCAYHVYDVPRFEWKANYSCDAWFICTCKDAVQLLACTVTSETIPATETEDGEIIYAAAVQFNGQTYTDTKTVVIPASTHVQHVTTLVPAVEATCEHTGNLAYYTCSGCDLWFEDAEATRIIEDHSRVIIPLADHSYSSVVTAATCTEQGYTTYTCVCGESYVSDYVEALGHTFGAWIVIQEPTTTENGVEEHTCTRCGHTEQRSIAKLENPFNDVAPGSFFYEPVMWAIENGITNGTSATTFGPNDQCMRAHVVTFLWRAVGSPEPTRTDNPFVDVKPTDFYYKPVLWAVENGITSGIDATHFGPTAYCNRAQVVTFLYRTMGNPAVGAATNPFTDVAAGSFYEKPVLWAVENGVAAGLSATSFGPNSICNRAQIVTFLYRAFVND